MTGAHPGETGRLGWMVALAATALFIPSLASGAAFEQDGSRPEASVTGQSSNVITVEMLNPWMTTMNYERSLSRSVSVKAGATISGSSGLKYKTFVPVVVNITLRGDRIRPVIGAGVAFVSRPTSGAIREGVADRRRYGVFIMGGTYHHHPGRRGFVATGSGTLFFDPRGGNLSLLPALTLGAGWAF